MELNSLENVRLLRNCIAIEIKKFQAMPNYYSSEVQEKIKDYTNLFHLVNTTDNAKSILEGQTGELAEFSKHMLSASEKDIIDEYLELTKALMLEAGYTDSEKFKKFEDAFCGDFKDKMILDNLNSLFKKNPVITMSYPQFKDFSEQFRDNVKLFAISKFGKAFESNHKVLQDIQISYDEENENKQYKTDFVLLNAEKNEEHFIVKTPASKCISNYIQNLCYSYLEADKYANIDNSSLNPELIRQQITDFRECYDILQKMRECDISISPTGKFIYTANTSYEPEKANEIAASKTEPEEAIQL